jgi:serine/threonine-protein kinase HipA
VSTQRVTGIGGAHHRDDELEGLMAYAGSFRVAPSAPKQILSEVLDATSDWRRVATENGVPSRELSDFADAFEGLLTPLSRLAL